MTELKVDLEIFGYTTNYSMSEQEHKAFILGKEYLEQHKTK